MKKDNYTGRPKIKLTKEILLSEYHKNSNWSAVAKNLGVSPATIYNRLIEFDVRKYV